jgi:hypothetical protein
MEVSSSLQLARLSMLGVCDHVTLPHLPNVALSIRPRAY